MAPDTNAAATQETILLNVFCAQEGEAWRVYVLPTRLPRYLHQFFDRHGEAYPALLDFDDLDRFMTANGVQYEKRVARTGGVELTARGQSATFLAQWLATGFASGLRPAGRSAR
jgi:hypothetical protein